MKTKLEIDTLKADWKRDRSWDIEDTPGFEEHAEELRAYRHKVEADDTARAAAEQRARIDELVQAGVTALEGVDLAAEKQAGGMVRVLLGAVAAMLLPVIDRIERAETTLNKCGDANEGLRDEIHELREQLGRA